MSISLLQGARKWIFGEKINGLVLCELKFQLTNSWTDWRQNCTTIKSPIDHINAICSKKCLDNDRPVPQVFLNNHVNHIMWLSRRIFIAFLWFSNKHSIYWKHLTTKVKFNEVQFANSSLLVEKKSWNDVMKRKVFPHIAVEVEINKRDIRSQSMQIREKSIVFRSTLKRHFFSFATGKTVP